MAVSVGLIMLNFEVGYTPTNLRLAITKLGVTQAELARLLGVAPQSVRNWLMPIGTKSRRNMDYEMWLKVLELLDVSEV